MTKPNQSLLSTSQPITRLLFTEEPFSDESLIGYLMRLTELNAIPDLRWIFTLIEIRRNHTPRFKSTTDFNIDLHRLCELTGSDIEKLKALLYSPGHKQTQNYIGDVMAFGQPLAQHFVRRENPKICPLCLSENNYCRRIWELAPITACPHHECLLLEHCPGCRRRISWRRLQISICECQFDFRKSAIVSLEKDDLQLTSVLYQKLNQLLPANLTLNNPLNGLEIDDLLRVLFFVAAHYLERADYLGEDLIKNADNSSLHELLNQAFKVFERWPESYHEFLKSWQTKDKRYFSNCSQIYLSNVQLPDEYADFELFNQVLHFTFEKPQFEFLHREFKNFLEAWRASTESSWQPTSFEDFREEYLAEKAKLLKPKPKRYKSIIPA